MHEPLYKKEFQLSFQDYHLNPQIIKAISELGFVEPTPVQAEVIPLLLDSNRQDLVALSQTGTGKTAAFGLPILSTLDYAIRSPQALILCPTRELCVQIERDFQSFARFIDNPGITAVYGGAPYRPQIDALKRGTRILTATPGRLRDLMNKGFVDFSSLNYLVLDEADTMLNMGFKEELDEILTSIPDGIQTLLFSATMPPEVARIAASYMHNPSEITMGTKNAGATTVEHKYAMVHARDKFLALKRLVDFYPDMYGIVFCRTRAGARETAEKLVREGYYAEALHGDLSQMQRDSTMDKFRDRSLKILVATDIAARGLDVQDLTHVIHYDLPDEMEVYTHRSGRTGRAGKSGLSLAIINMRERHKIRRIEQLIKKRITETHIPTGKDICTQQLLSLIEKIESSEIDEKLIAPFLPTIEEKLNGLDREEIIKKVVSLEFNHFLSYYGKTPDLNPVTANSERRTERRDQPRKREQYKTDDSFVWLTINLGIRDHFGKKDLLGLVNRHMGNTTVPLGKITCDTTNTRFQVPSAMSEQVAAALSRMNASGKRTRVKHSEGFSYSGGSSGAKKNRGKKKRRT